MAAPPASESLTLQPIRLIDGTVRCAFLCVCQLIVSDSTAPRLPGSKSLSNRILLLAALAGALLQGCTRGYSQ